MIERYVWDLEEVDGEHVAVVGGKGAHLGELHRVEGIRVPEGFCVTTGAFRRAVEGAPEVVDGIERLSRVDPDDREALRTLSAKVRRAIEETPLPDEVAAAVTSALARTGEEAAYAVRSSATAEDLPTASFAGQQDTYLNVLGPAEVLRYVGGCWASLFTERAVAYRRQQGIDDRAVRMAVVVQKMVVPEAAGVLFTADPVTGNRTVATVDAGFGLGEALVSGLVNPDVFTVRHGEVVARSIGVKQRAVHAVAGGGTRTVEIEPERQKLPALTDAQVTELVRLGRRIEAHFGRPQDIEWCLTDDGFRIVQSRPITTLYPLPESGDEENRVYLSVGHQQMMTDAMKPLGLSVWQLTAMAPMLEAGGRLFVDCTARLASPASRAAFLDMVGRSDPLTRDALETVLERDGFVPTLPDTVLSGAAGGRFPARSGRDRSGRRHRAGRAQPGVPRRPAPRHRREDGYGAVRLPAGGRQGAQAGPRRSAEHPGDHGGDGGHVVAQRPAAGMAGREQRGRHAHPVRPRQHHLADGPRAARRGGRRPSVSGGGGVPAGRRGRRLPGPAGGPPGRGAGA